VHAHRRAFAQQMHDAVLPLAPCARRLRRDRGGGRLAPGPQAEQKIKKDGSGRVPPLLGLTENPDILATVARRCARAALFCVGFAAESHDLLASTPEPSAAQGRAAAGGQHRPGDLRPGRQRAAAGGRRGRAAELPHAAQADAGAPLVAEIDRRCGWDGLHETP
jgi:phosphopantothenoylcysteine decarboxylase/phosphopantothenate--cysteine ligase